MHDRVVETLELTDRETAYCDENMEQSHDQVVSAAIPHHLRRARIAAVLFQHTAGPDGRKIDLG